MWDRAGFSIFTGGLSGLQPAAEFWIESPGCGLPSYDRKRSVVASDFIELKFKEGGISFASAGARSIAGFCTKGGARFILKGSERPVEALEGIAFIRIAGGFLAASGTGAKKREFYLPSYDFDHKFAVTCGKSKKECRENLARLLQRDSVIAAIEKNKAAFSKLLPPLITNLKNEALRGTAAKAASILKVNVQSPYSVIPSRWTTPDRMPHRDMWLWDSAFHSAGWACLDRKMARDALTAVFLTQRKNGCIPICARHKGNQTQPPILAWGVWRLFEREKDPRLLEETYGKLAKFLGFFEKRRRDKKSGLFFWEKEENTICRAGESGLDNSPLYDGRGKQLSCDLSSYMANSYELLGKMALRLKKPAEARAWRKKYLAVNRGINKLLWDPKTEFFYDRELGGELLREKSATGFYPIFAGAVSRKRFNALLKHLNNKDEFKTKFPVPTVSRDNSCYGKDMWRGPAWINSNWLIIEGLLRYGKKQAALALAKKTLEEICRWYQKTGVLCEYYDAEGLDDPRFLPRKNYGGSGYLGVVRDYGWTAAGFLRLLELVYGQEIFV